MAHLLRLKLQALHCPRPLFSRSRVTRLLSSPDQRQIAWRSFGESALLEDSCSSTHIDGGSLAANKGEDLSMESNGFEEKADSGAFIATEKVSPKSLMDKLKSSISEKVGMKSNKASTQLEEHSSSIEHNQWKQVINTLRPMTFKKPAPVNDSDLDVTHAADSKSFNSSNKFVSATNTLGKIPKQKAIQFESSNLQKGKDTKPVSFNFLKSLDTDGATSRVHVPKNKNTPDSMEMPVRFDSKMSQGIEGAPSRTETTGKLFSSVEERSSSNSSSVPNLGHMVCIQNVPANSNPALVKAAMSVHGEVVGSFKKAFRNDSLTVYIQLKTAEAVKSALAARRLQVGGKFFNITRVEIPITTVVRLSKVSPDSTENEVLSMCERYGSVDNLVRRENGTFDVFYQVKELPNISSILGSLNEVMLNRRTWVATPAPILHPAARNEVLKSTEGQIWHENQVHMVLNRIESGLDIVSVLFEDLKHLNYLGKELSK